MLIIGNLQKNEVSRVTKLSFWSVASTANKQKALKKFKFHLKHTVIIIIDILSPPTRNDK
jgi:hypothetical protein